MAVDFKSLDKKKLGIFIAAVIAGLIAVALTGRYIEESSSKKAMILGGGEVSKRFQALEQQLEFLKKSNANLNASLSNVQKQAIAAARSQTPKPIETKPQISLGLKTPSGRRAVTILIDKLAAVGGMVAPGDYVDIIAHLAVPNDPKNPTKAEIVSVTLFQNVLVVAVNGKTEPSPGALAAKKSTEAIPVTIALNPDEAALISFAQQHGRLQMILRSPLDTQAYRIPASTWQSLSDYILATQGTDINAMTQDDEEPTIDEAKPSSGPTIEIFKGGQF